MGLPNGQWPQAYFQSFSKCLKDNKVKVLEWSSQSPDLNPIENVWAQLKKRCEQWGLTNLTQLHQLCNEEKFTQLIVGSLWKVTRNVWPKLNNLKAMLPNRTHRGFFIGSFYNVKHVECGVPQGSSLGPLLFLDVYQWHATVIKQRLCVHVCR